VKLGVESTGNTRYFRDRMEAAGAQVTVINTLKFKVVNESVKKTDKHDAATIAEFLEKGMLPESVLCSRESEEMRRLLKTRTTLVRARVTIKNQIHALLVAEGMEDVKASLQSRKGRQKVLDALKERQIGLAAHPLFEIIDRLGEDIKMVEEKLAEMAAEDKDVELLKTIPGCGDITAWTIKAFMDDVKRYASAKKFASYCGLAPWVQNSNESVRHGKITKRGPQELRTAMVQLVMGIIRCRKDTASWRMVQNYDLMKKVKGSGKSIIAAARKIATVVWNMLSSEQEFNPLLMVGKDYVKVMKELIELKKQAADKYKKENKKQWNPVSETKAAMPVVMAITKMTTKNPGVAGKKKKVG
jgi:transposase